MNQVEIARALQTTPSTIYVALHRAIRLVLQRREVPMMHLGVEIAPEQDVADDPAELFRKTVETDLRFLGRDRTNASSEEIRRLADRQLAAFLEEQHRQQLMEPREAGWIRDLADVRDSLLHAFGALRRVCVRTGRLAAVGLIVALIGMVLVLHVRDHGVFAKLANPVVARLVDSMNAKWDVEIEKDAALHRGPLKLEQGYAHLVSQKGAKV